MGWLRSQVEKLAERKDLHEIVFNAFLESSPLKKMHEMHKGVGLTQKFLADKWGRPDALGADEYVAVLMAYFIQANPPSIVLNYVFFQEFCSSGPYESLFEAISRPGMAICGALCQLLPGFDIATFIKKRPN
jgi:hypothetical protein